MRWGPTPFGMGGVDADSMLNLVAGDQTVRAEKKIKQTREAVPHVDNTFNKEITTNTTSTT